MSTTPFFYLGKARRGVSPVVSVLLMVGVAIALGGFVGLYVSSYMSSSSQMASLSITNVELTKLSGHVYFLISLRNIGTVPLSIVNVTIHTSQRLYYVDKPLSKVVSPGSSQTITEEELARAGCLLNPVDFNPGERYLIRVYAEGGGSRSTYSIITTCQG